jgi:hypothetical protein
MGAVRDQLEVNQTGAKLCTKNVGIDQIGDSEFRACGCQRPY